MRRVGVATFPYDSGLRGVGMGRGPARVLDAGLVPRLEAAGYDVRVVDVTAEAGPVPSELSTAFAGLGALAGSVAATVEDGGFPIVLSGSCYATVGAVSGLGAPSAGVVWFDSHGDLHTPATTASGFLDGMALSWVAGRGFETLLRAIPGYAPVAPDRLLLAGARDLDPAERALVEEGFVRCVPPAVVRDRWGEELDAWVARCEGVYVHLDLDVLDPRDGRANGMAAPEGLRRGELLDALADIRRRSPVLGLSLTAYDPHHDPDGRVAEVAVRAALSLLADG